jgi:NAD(P)-dependent dehydrogenase (short-subunit alcohol dehydrogenase family)
MTQTDLTGKVAIVTGAGHGAGAAIARALAAAGAGVAVNDINPDRAHRVAAEIRERGGAAIDVMADVSNRFQCVNLIETTRAKWERVDIVVNGASIAPVASILKMDEWEWARCLDVNLKGVFLMSQLAGRVMADQRQAGGDPGLIVNLVAAEPEGDGRAAFIASQAAVAAFGRACAREFAPLGIRVVTLRATASPEEIAATAMEIMMNNE